jgi:hypothetical protein
MSKEGRKNMDKYRKTAKFHEPIYLDKHAGTSRMRKVRMRREWEENGTEWSWQQR